MVEFSWERNYSKTKSFDLSNPKVRKIMIIGLILTGIFLLGLSFHFYVSTSSYLKSAKSVEGTVIKLLPIEDDENNTTYAPVFEFKDQAGQSHVIESSLGRNPPAFEKGQKVEVLYDPASPQNAKLNEFFSLWGVAVIVGFIGMLSLIFGLILFFIKKEKINVIQNPFE